MGAPVARGAWRLGRRALTCTLRGGASRRRYAARLLAFGFVAVVASGAPRLGPILAIEHVTIQRMEHVGIVVDDLPAATEFFVELGLELRGEAPAEGPLGWTVSWGSRASAWTLRSCKLRTATDDSS